MFKLRIKQLLFQGKRDHAEAILEGAWRATSARIGYRDAAIMILRNLDKEHWDLIPSVMFMYILENFNANYDHVVPGEHREQADNPTQP